MPLEPGTRLGHFEIASLLGSGGMGEVYRARDTRLEREVAIKILPEHLAADPDHLARFQREARVLAALNHPNIVTVHSVEEAGGRHFLAMELVEGDDLGKLIPERGMPLERFLAIAIPLVEALIATHERGITHRDLKPSNALLDRNGHVKVLDFGLACHTMAVGSPGGFETNIATRTRDAAVAGTVPYMSPEQLAAGPIDHRSDIFSLGVLFYEMIAGRRPFAAESAALTISAILRDQPLRLLDLRPDLPAPLSALVERCLAKQPAARFQSASELRDALRAIASGELDVSAEPPRSGRVEAARRALAEQRWQQAFDLLHQAEHDASPLSDELELLGEAAFWTGHHEVCVRARERAFALRSEAGQNEAAALLAVQLAHAYHYRGARAVASAWLSRAERLVEDRQGSAAHGYALRFQTYLALELMDFERALGLARRVVAIAQDCRDRGLLALGTQDQGRALVFLGKLAEGLALIDEAMAAAMSEGLPAEIVGRTFCNMISVCESLADYRRAAEWCQAAGRFLEPHAASWFPGICRVHRAELLRLKGEWREAEREARSAAEELGASLPDVAAEAIYQIGEIQFRRGEHAEAEASFRRAHELGRDPLPGLALLRLAQGKPEAADKLMARALADESLAPLHRAKLLPARFETALAKGDLEAASRATQELQVLADAYRTTALRAQALTARGQLLLAEGDASAAIRELREAAALWRDVELDYHAARTREFLAEGYARSGSPEDAALEREAALRAFEALGAAADAQRIRRRLAG